VSRPHYPAGGATRCVEGPAEIRARSFGEPRCFVKGGRRGPKGRPGDRPRRAATVSSKGSENTHL